MKLTAHLANPSKSFLKAFCQTAQAASTLMRSSARLSLLTTIVLHGISGHGASTTTLEDASTVTTALHSFELMLSQLPVSEDPNLKYFLDQQELTTLRSHGSSDLAAQFGSGFGHSAIAPVPLYNKAAAGDGGVVLFHDQIFSEGFFRQHIGDAKYFNSAKGVTTQKLVTGQPWFQWNAGNKKWIYRQDGAQTEILRDVGSTLGVTRLFRGTTTTEWNLIRIFQILKTPDLNLNLTTELQSQVVSLIAAPESSDGYRIFLRDLEVETHDPQFLNSPQQRELWAERDFDAYFVQLTGAKKDALFLTPDQFSAQGWTKSALLEWDTSQEHLLDESDRGSIYVGIEYNYVEVALPSRESLHEYFGHAKLVAPQDYLRHNPNDDE